MSLALFADSKLWLRLKKLPVASVSGEIEASQ
jgi:hypothetical protein